MFETTMNEWIPFQQIDWNNSSFNKFNIDTRDFHVLANVSDPHPDEGYLHSKYPDSFFHSIEELKSLLQRYYLDSGAETDWRFFSLTKNDNWSLKYIRIYRTAYGFLLCNSEDKALRKDILSSPVIKRLC